MELEDTASVLARHRFGILFVLLLCALLIPPYFDEIRWFGDVWRTLFTIVLFWALYTVAGSRRIMLLAILFLIPTVSSTWLNRILEAHYVAYIDNCTNILYFGLICWFMARYIFTVRKVTLEVIFAAMCLYMLMAVLWAAIFANIQMYYGDAFTFYGQTAVEYGINKGNLFNYMIYYSFVTLSTLGYGDIVPINRVAQSWATMEAMIGQFFIAIVMARLVSMYTVEESRD